MLSDNSGWAQHAQVVRRFLRTGTITGGTSVTVARYSARDRPAGFGGAPSSALCCAASGSGGMVASNAAAAWWAARASADSGFCPAMPIRTSASGVPARTRRRRLLQGLPGTWQRTRGPALTGATSGQHPFQSGPASSTFRLAPLHPSEHAFPGRLRLPVAAPCHTGIAQPVTKDAAVHQNGSTFGWSFHTESSARPVGPRRTRTRPFFRWARTFVCRRPDGSAYWPMVPWTRTSSPRYS
jgi:hypothetical protein